MASQPEPHPEIAGLINQGLMISHGFSDNKACYLKALISQERLR